jgi:hypothetical protein
MSVPLYEHMIPATSADRALVHRLGDAVGRRGRAVELALEWAILACPAPDPAFRPEIQIHVSLDRNYRSEFDPPVLGQYLHLGINRYWAHYRDSILGKKGIEYWTVAQPEGALRAIHRRAFGEARDVRDQYAEDYRAAVVSLLKELRGEEGPFDVRSKDVTVPVDSETRGDYAELTSLAGALGWEQDQLIEKRMAELVRRRG